MARAAKEAVATVGAIALVIGVASTPGPPLPRLLAAVLLILTFVAILLVKGPLPRRRYWRGVILLALQLAIIALLALGAAALLEDPSVVFAATSVIQLSALLAALFLAHLQAGRLLEIGWSPWLAAAPPIASVFFVLLGGELGLAAAAALSLLFALGLGLIPPGLGGPPGDA